MISAFIGQRSGDIEEYPFGSAKLENKISLSAGASEAREMEYLATGQLWEEEPYPKYKEQTGYYEKEKGAVQEINSSANLYRPSTSIEDIEHLITLSNADSLMGPKLSQQAEQILRIHFAKQLLGCMNIIQTCKDKSLLVSYVGELFSIIRNLEQALPCDRFTEIVMALYDALAYQNNWEKFDSAQYKETYLLLKRIATIKYISDELKEKIIMKFEEIGFDTTPFELISGTDSDDNKL